MAGNLWVCDERDCEGKRGQQGEVVLVQDATAAWGKGGYEPELVHRIHVESLKEFASVRDTETVVTLWESWL
jgi:hypothetical protein